MIKQYKLELSEILKSKVTEHILDQFVRDGVIRLENLSDSRTNADLIRTLNSTYQVNLKIGMNYCEISSVDYFEKLDLFESTESRASFDIFDENYIKKGYYRFFNRDDFDTEILRLGYTLMHNSSN